MNSLAAMNPQNFSVLSIGQRGVGKTVFLAGSYTELQSAHQSTTPQRWWFDCQDSQVQENIDNLLSYISRTGQYPPSTLKITKLNFSLKQDSLQNTQALSHLEWWELPGECCNITNNPDFRKIVRSSHGCCVFIDAYALLHDPTYLHKLEDVIKQVMAIANLVHLNSLKYPFALILTKCDLVEPSLLSQQLDKNLQPLTTRLDAAGVIYQTFHTFVPIVYAEGALTLKPQGAAAPLLWLVQELSKSYQLQLQKNRISLFPRLQPVDFQQQKLVDGSLRSLFSQANKAPQVKNILGLYLLPATRKYLLLLTLGSTVLLGLLFLSLANSRGIFRNELRDFAQLQDLDTLQQSGQFEQAVTLMEKLVQQEPQRLEWRLQLARLYEITGQVLKAETAYDQILAQHKNHLKALIGKAVIRDAQGDTKTAQALFAQAEQAAPTKVKPQIRAVAEKTFASP